MHGCACGVGCAGLYFIELQLEGVGLGAGASHGGVSVAGDFLVDFQECDALDLQLAFAFQVFEADRVRAGGCDLESQREIDIFGRGSDFVARLPSADGDGASHRVVVVFDSQHIEAFEVLHEAGREIIVCTAMGSP